MWSTKKLEVHCNIHMDGQGRKMVTLENVEVCCKAWYIIRVVSKAGFYRFQYYSSQGQCSRFHGSFSTKKLKEATCQAAMTLSTIIFPFIDVMSHKTIYIYIWSKLSVIKNKKFTEYIMKRHGKKISRCIACEK